MILPLYENFGIKIHNNPQNWYKYIKPIWLNSISYEKGQRKIFRWTFFVYSTK